MFLNCKRREDEYLPLPIDFVILAWLLSTSALFASILSALALQLLAWVLQSSPHGDVALYMRIQCKNIYLLSN